MRDWHEGGPADDEEFESPDLPGEGDESPWFEHEELEDALRAEAVTPELEPSDIQTELLRAEPLGPIDEVRDAHRALEDQLLVGALPSALAAESGTEAYGLENIVGVGIAEKISGGQYTGRLAATVYVVAKAPLDNIASEARVPSEIEGVPTDVVATGELRALPHTGRYRPAPSGVSVAHYRVTAGTLGCLVRRGTGLYILSNNHVLANSNASRLNDPILQPGPADGGGRGDVIAALKAAVPIQFGGNVNYVDAAVAQTQPRMVSVVNRCLGRIASGPIACSRGLVVRKCGRTTQHTRGIITDCNATVRVGYPPGAALFRDQIIVAGVAPTSTFSRPGDSGSLIVSEVLRRPVGLLFAGSATHTIANKIGRVLNAFGVSVVA